MKKVVVSQLLIWCQQTVCALCGRPILQLSGWFDVIWALQKSLTLKDGYSYSGVVPL